MVFRIDVTRRNQLPIYMLGRTVPFGPDGGAGQAGGRCHCHTTPPTQGQCLTCRPLTTQAFVQQRLQTLVLNPDRFDSCRIDHNAFVCNSCNCSSYYCPRPKCIHDCANGIE